VKNPVFVAIDTSDRDRARAIVELVGPSVGGIKLGLEYFAAHGPVGVAEIAALGLPLFLDLKLHDIPNTVSKAVAALAPLKPAVLTVHAGGGQAMLEAAKAAAPAETKVVAVTVLTSLDRGDLVCIGVPSSPETQVVRLTELAKRSGLDGIVCSGEEVEAAKDAWPTGFFVVPGVRPGGAADGDQKRVMTPRDALSAGASILVVGRPITASDDPARAAADIAGTLQLDSAAH
jgi:orotidine-5'-phosphate decarboxylase